jgi:hypothetical protein
MTADMFATLERTIQLVDEGDADEAYHVLKTAVTEDRHGFARIFLAAWIKHIEDEEESAQKKFAEILLLLKEDFPELSSSREEEFIVKVPAPQDAMPLWLAPLDEPAMRHEDTEIEMVTPSPFSSEPEPDATVPSQVQPPEQEETEPEAQPAQSEAPTATEATDVPQPAQESVEPPVDEAPVAVDKSEPLEPTVDSLVNEPVETAPTVDKVVDKPVEKPVKPKPVVEAETEHLTLTFYEWQMSAIHKAASKENMDENALLAQMLQTRKLEPLMWSRYKQGKTTSPAHRITISVPHKTKAKLERDKDFEGIKTTTKYVRKVLFGTRAEKA